MMRGPFSIFHFLLFFVVLVFLFTFIQIGILSIVLEKLGLSPGSAVLLFLCTLAGSAINLPLFTLEFPPDYKAEPPRLPPWILARTQSFQGRTVIAINVGGALIPTLFSLYLLLSRSLPLDAVLVAIIMVTTVSYMFSRPIPGLGIGMPVLIAPLTAALAAVLMAPEHSPPVAYISGTLGVLIGADLLRLKDIAQLATPVAAIGGAGTFDGIFFTGIIAVLLA